jgi:Tat protein secretion system quality control protein TatD with DNase activity
MRLVAIGEVGLDHLKVKDEGNRELQGRSEDEVAEAVSQNARRLFGDLPI